jgi:hypothetical protein
MLLRSGRKLLEIARRRLIMRQTVITTILVQVADLQRFYVWFTDESCKHDRNYHKSSFELKLANVKCNGETVSTPISTVIRVTSPILLLATASSTTTEPVTLIPRNLGNQLSPTEQILYWERVVLVHLRSICLFLNNWIKV